jgi:hypothetical protein
MSLVGTKQTCRLRRAMSAFGGWSQPVDATLYLKGEMEWALMGQRFHRGFTAAEKTELWDRWKRGESLKAIGRAFGENRVQASRREVPKSCGSALLRVLLHRIVPIMVAKAR